MLYIPCGFAHGFITSIDNVNFVYKVDRLYSCKRDRSIRFDDPTIGIDWEIDNPVHSPKVDNAPLLCESDCNFIYGSVI